jgi:Bacterial Ig-like domain (group 3)
MYSVASMRFMPAKFGIAVLASACLAAGVSGIASGATHTGTSATSCASPCPSLTRLSITGPVTTFGSEENVVFNVRVKPRVLHTGETPTGTVTVGYHATVLCTIVLASGTGSCSPSPTALPARNKGYPINAVYGGDATFSPSHSGARHMRVTA